MVPGGQGAQWPLRVVGGGFGSDAIFSIRTGVNDVGVSGGVALNLGLIQLELASLAQDIGLDNNRVLERRNVAVVSINVLED